MYWLLAPFLLPITKDFVSAGELSESKNWYRYANCLGGNEATGYIDNVNDVTHWMPLPSMP